MTIIGVLGLGQIGGSVALAARLAGHPVLGWDADLATRDEAAERGLRITSDLGTAEVIVLAVPMPGLTHGLGVTLAGLRLSADATLTDVGSLKTPVAAAMDSAGLSQRYIGGHPMAGTERSGFGAADAAAFTAVRWALCVDNQTDLARWLAVAGLITDLGARVLALTAAEHDAAMGMVSGLPHLLALALASSAVRSGALVSELAAGSFADLTRVAGSDPALLRAVTQDNAPAVRKALRLVLEQIDRPWPDLIADGHDAKDRLRRRVQAGSPAEEVNLRVSNVDELLELGRLGALIERVDAGTGDASYRLPPTS